METIKIKQPLPVYSLPGQPPLPAGTEITLTEKWESFPINARCRVILVGAREYSVSDEELAAAQHEPKL